MSVIGLSFLVVHRGEARIRVKLSAAHKPKHVEQAISAYTKIGWEYDVLARQCA
jgi:glycine C-acetyltransferase